MHADARRTQIIYNEWNVPPQAGYVRRFDAGFEFGMSTLGLLICPWGPRRKKTILDRQIHSVTHCSNWLIIRFDSDDELMVNDRILRDFDQASVSFPVLHGFSNESSGILLRSLQDRQRRLGPASWEHGRTGPMTSSSAIARRAKAALITVAAVALAFVFFVNR